MERTDWLSFLMNSAYDDGALCIRLMKGNEPLQRNSSSSMCSPLTLKIEPLL